MTDKPLKRPRDPAQLAKLMIDIASGEVTEGQPTAKQARARKGGIKDRPARSNPLPQSGAQKLPALPLAPVEKGLDRRRIIVAAIRFCSVKFSNVIGKLQIEV